MKILFFYQYFGTPKGGWSTRVYELTKRWVKEGHQVTVVTSPYEKSDIKADGFISKQQIEGINLIVIDTGDSNRYAKIKRVFRAIMFSFWSIWFALFRKYDVAIASSGPITIGLPLIFAKLFRRKKTIFEVRDLWPAGGIEMGIINKKWQQKSAFWFEKKCYHHADLVVTASIGQKEHIAMRFPNKRIEVVSNASDNDLFGKQNEGVLPDWASGKTLLTHIGSLGLIHNMNYWITVAHELSKIDKNNLFVFVFIGDGAERNKLESRAVHLNLTNVFFLGLKPKNELSIWVQNSMATLFATLDNPVQNTCSPNKIFDSFAAGIPIIQTSSGWIYDLVEQHKCGINIPIHHPARAAQEIYCLSKKPKEVEAMGRNAKNLAMNQFNRDFLSAKYLDLIEKS